MTWRSKALIELALATRDISHGPDDTRTVVVLLGLWGFRWRLHLNEPGCLVGEQRHLRPTTCRFGFDAVFFVSMEWFNFWENQGNWILSLFLFWGSKLVGGRILVVEVLGVKYSFIWNCDFTLITFSFGKF